MNLQPNPNFEIRRKDLIKIVKKDHELHLSEFPYLPNHNWSQHHHKLHTIQAVMTPSRDLIDLILELQSGKKMFHGNGDIISSTRKKEILDYIIKKVNPWRAENLDNYFHVFNDETYMDTNHIVLNNKIEHTKRDKVDFIGQFGLTSFKYFNKDGLASKLKGEEVRFNYPENNRIARFSADSGGAGLYCGRDPTYSDTELGVRTKFYSIDHLDK